MRQCQQAQEWLKKFDQPWGIAGGWAIDLFAGKQTREHSDLEVTIQRKDQHFIKKALPDWSFRKVVKGEFHEWTDERLYLPIHELHARQKKSGRQLEVLLNEVTDGHWVFRRDPEITFPASSLFLATTEGVPYLHPVVVLLYKAKGTRPKDHLDFETAYPLLAAEDQKWLLKAMRTHAPAHEWIHQMEGVLA